MALSQSIRGGGLNKRWDAYSQEPGKYHQGVLEEAGVNIYDKMEESRSSASGYACGIPLIPFAYLICFYLFVEGLVVLIEDPKLGMKGPFEGSEVGYLHVVAWGDIIVSVLGAVGIWFGSNLLPMGWRHTSKMHGTIASLGSGLLLVWRALVCLSFAPWAGIVLAFATSDENKAWIYVFICLYIALCIFIVYVLALSFRQVVEHGRWFQRHLDSQHTHERKQLLTAAAADGQSLDEYEVEPELFGCLPLAETVTFYTFIMAIACLFNFIFLCVTLHSSGGWAFFASKPQINSTFWLEAFLWPISFICAIIGIGGASSFANGGARFASEESSLNLLRIFLIASMLRFALLFAVTGMDIIEKDTCGLYINGLARVAYSSYWSSANGFIHCTPLEYLFLAGTLLCCLLDGYLIWGTFSLWRFAQLQGWRNSEKQTEGYSSVEDVNQGRYQDRS